MRRKIQSDLRKGRDETFDEDSGSTTHLGRKIGTSQAVRFSHRNSLSWIRIPIPNSNPDAHLCWEQLGERETWHNVAIKKNPPSPLGKAYLSGAAPEQVLYVAFMFMWVQIDVNTSSHKAL